MNPKQIYSVTKSYYINNDFIRFSPPLFYSSLRKAIESLKVDARIYNGEIHSCDSLNFSITTYREFGYKVVVSIDRHLLF